MIRKGSIIVLGPDVTVSFSGGGEKTFGSDKELWGVDDIVYGEANKVEGINISRLLRPSPGALCGWIELKDIGGVLKF